jgi:hypothetical protein
MAEAEEEDAIAQVTARGAEDAGKRSDPKNGRTGAARRLQQAAEKALDENTPKIVNCLIANIEGNHLPSAKMLIDLANGLRGGGENEIPEEGYLSLADVLWKELEEPETGNRNW